MSSGYYGGEFDREPVVGQPLAAPPKRRRWLRWVLGLFAFFVVIIVGAVTILYFAVHIPKPNQIATNQVSTITFADGKTVLAKVGTQNRTDVPLSKVPDHVRWAVLAAEDRNYYGEPGISVKGIVRAAWNDVRGQDIQGGSTITQQYVKNAFLTQQRTFTRKLKEIVIAVKLDRKYSKDQILQWYLNTIYFGRGAYGIEAAAETYFGKPVNELSVAEGAVLAASIRAPAIYDPEDHPGPAKTRWQFVIDGMVSMGKLPQQEADTLRYPSVKPIGRSTINQLSGPWGYIVEQVKDELAARGVNEAELGRDGLRIVTTIDPRAQHDAEKAVRDTFAGQPRDLRQALVAVDPGTGKVLAYYGGSSGYGFDYAQAWRQPGSSFKPYVLATALTQTEHGKAAITDGTEYDGSTPQSFDGVVVHNSDGESCGYCSVKTAMTMSLNTVFYRMGLQVGPKNVAATAHAAGIPLRRSNDGERTLQDADGRVDGGISIGQYEVRPIDQAAAFATFADGGVRHAPYFVEKVTDAAGHVLYEHRDGGKRVLSKPVANDVTYSLENVASWSSDPLAGGRQVAAKTGTAQLGETPNNKDAWMVGYTPRICAAVWVGTNASKPLYDATGRIVYGSGLPGKAWQEFMNSYLDGTPMQPLPSSALVGAAGDVPAPTTTPALTTPPPTTAAATVPPPTTVSPTTAPPTTVPPTTTAPPTTTPPTTTPPPTTRAPTRTPPPTTAPPTTSPPPASQSPPATKTSSPAKPTQSTTAGG